MPKSVQFVGSIHRIVTDGEGETTITLKAPLTERRKLLGIDDLLQMALTVTVEPQQGKFEFTTENENGENAAD